MKNIVYQVLDEICDLSFSRSGIQIPDFVVVADKRLRTKPRHFAAIEYDIDPVCIYYHPDLLHQKISRIRGVLVHEIGHYLDLSGYFYDEMKRISDGERRADVAAEMATGWHIYYDGDTVQVAGPGARGRKTRPVGLR